MISQFIGYAGAFFLTCRFVPIIFGILCQKVEPVNVIFLFLELIASILLGTSAIMIQSYPFVICNTISGVSVIFILLAQWKKILNKNKSSNKITNKNSNKSPT